MKLVLFSFFILILASCGESPDRRSRTVSNRIFTNPIKIEEIFEEPNIPISTWLEQVEMDCSEKECPDFMAVLLAASGGQRDFCTSFFIEPQIIATNRHCLPDGLKIDQADCSTGIAFKSINGKFTCDKVLKVASEEDKKFKGRDLAFLKTKERSQSWVGVERFQIAGMANQLLTATMWKVSLESETSANFSLEKSDCGVGIVKGSEQFTTTDCLIEKGNSGSAIINEFGSSIGLIFGFLDKGSIKQGDAGLGTLFNQGFWY